MQRCKTDMQGSWVGLGSPLRACDLQAGVGIKQLEWGLGTFGTSSLMLVPTLAHRSRAARARTAMALACRLGLLLSLLLLAVGASLPGTVVRLNKAALSYGKRCAAGVSRVSVRVDL